MFARPLGTPSPPLSSALARFRLPQSCKPHLLDTRRFADCAHFIHRRRFDARHSWPPTHGLDSTRTTRSCVRIYHDQGTPLLHLCAPHRPAPAARPRPPVAYTSPRHRLLLVAPKLRDIPNPSTVIRCAFGLVASKPQSSVPLSTLPHHPLTLFQDGPRHIRPPLSSSSTSYHRSRRSSPFLAPGARHLDTCALAHFHPARGHSCPFERADH